MKRVFIAFSVALSLAGVPDVRGQSIGPATLNATGGFGTISGNEFEWSVCEMTVISTYFGSTFTAAQGILQPDNYPLYIAQLTAPVDNMYVFPNPTSDVVTLQYTSTVYGTMAYRILDITGKVLDASSVNMINGLNAHQLNLTSYANGVYLLQIDCNSADASTQSFTYKIVKNN